MGATAETLAERYEIGREEQDRYAVESQRRCEEARNAGRFDAEKAPVMISGKKGLEPFLTDEHPRDGATLEGMRKLAPVFKKDGTIHAGNSSGITDGAAALVVLSAAAADRLGVSPMARLAAYTVAGVDPKVMGIGPVPAVRKLLDKTGLRLNDIDLIELNEAFAAQVIACNRELELDMERVNVNGGAIALGHPIGATGTRIVATLLHEMARRDVKRGLATLCISGGMGMALLFERD
jgi:acetyl-CoA C-acetyltransferase